jgi:RNA polymerase sigma-70 factor (ECF subfamily)
MAGKRSMKFTRPELWGSEGFSNLWLMGELGKPMPDESRPSLAVFRENYGFIPKVFRAQAAIPRLVDAEAALANTILFRKTELARAAKELVALVEAAAEGSAYCAALHYQTLMLLGEPAQRLNSLVANPRAAGLPANLDACLVRAWTGFVSTLAVGLMIKPDFPAPGLNASEQDTERSGAVYTGRLDGPEDLAEFAFFREQFGLIPNLFRVQALRPDALDAEAQLISAVLIPEDGLSRLSKEKLMLAVAGCLNNEYAVALFSALLGKRGVPAEECDRIAADEGAATNESERMLLDFGARLARSEAGEVMWREAGFSELQMVEAAATVALAKFFVRLQITQGVGPDFEPRPMLRRKPQKMANLFVEQPRHTAEDIAVDQDIDIVNAVRNGDVDAFEGLIDRHSRRIYRTLVGILGDAEDARDAMQDTFLKAFQYLDNFQGRSKFSTWLVSIATNTGIQRLRERKALESLDEGSDTEEGFRPRQIRAWTDDPEQMYSKTERQRLIESSVMKLPPKYRVVLILRDMEQLSTEEAASALGLAVPTLKSRLLRGRLMLREALSPHFANRANEVSN